MAQIFELVQTKVTSKGNFSMPFFIVYKYSFHIQSFTNFTQLEKFTQFSKIAT